MRRAPGLGTLRRNPDLKWRQSPKAVAELQLKQRAILDSAARLLKPGGRLVYATCSLLRAENEDVADAFEAQHAATSRRWRRDEVLAQARVSAAADARHRRATCACGRTSTAPTASLRRSGSGGLICRKRSYRNPRSEQPALSSSLA